MEQVRIDFLVTGNMSSLQGQVQALNASLMESSAAAQMLGKSMSSIDAQAANRQFAQMLNSSGMFNTQMVRVKSSVEQYADALNRAKLSGRQYWQESMRYIRGQSGAIRSLASEQLRLQNSLIQPLGRDAMGRVSAAVHTPTGIPTDAATNLRLANKQWEIFNHQAQQGATHMVNWGKNTQWAGRQLMVGFTVPMMMLGGLAAKTFKDLDEELVRLQKVYGSGFTFGEQFKEQSQMIREEALKMADSMAAAFGQAGTETAALMADLAAAGFENQDLMRMTEQTTKLATLGEVERTEAMKATISMQTAFGLSSEEVGQKVLFLNAVENQTSASLQDLVEAIPRAGTVVKGLGGGVEDLAMYMVAMREGGISAAEGANALKSGLSSIIAPSKDAVAMLKELGINLPQLVKQNEGDLTGTLVAFQQELSRLDDLSRQQVITKLFGKYQFARMNALFNNLGAVGSQTQQVAKLAGMSLEELGTIADQELAAKMESASGRWNKAWEQFKLTIADLGETMLDWGTKILNVVNKVFSALEDNQWLMEIVKYGGLALAVIGPIIMMMGLFGNMLGMITKGALRLINTFKALGSGGGISKSFEILTAESVAASVGIESFDSVVYDHAKAQEVLTQAVNELSLAFEGLNAAARNAAGGVATVGAAESGLNLNAKAQGRYAVGGVGFFVGNAGANSSLRQNPRTVEEMAAMPDAQRKLVAQSMVLDMVQADIQGMTSEQAIATKNLTNITSQLVSGEKQLAQWRAAGMADTAEYAALEQKMAAVKAEIVPATQAATAALVDETEVQRRLALASTEAGRMELARENQARELEYQASGPYQGKKGQHLPRVTAFNYAASTSQGFYDPSRAAVLPSLVSDDMADFASLIDEQKQAFEHLTPSSWALDKRLQVITAAMDGQDEAARELTKNMLQSIAAGQGVLLSEEALEQATNQLLGARRASMEAEALVAQKALAYAQSLTTGENAWKMSQPGMQNFSRAVATAAEGLENTGISAQTLVQEVNGVTRRYIGAVDDAGNVIEGTTYRVDSAGRTTAIGMDEFNAAAQNATTTTTRLAASADLAAVSNIEESAASIVAEQADLREASGSGAATYPGLIPGAPGTPPPTAKPPWYKRQGVGMGVGAGLMGAGMAGTMFLPDSPISTTASLSMMGAGIGSMIPGPWGMAGGAAIGAGLGLAGYIHGELTEGSRQAAEDFKKDWAAASSVVGDDFEESLGEAFDVKKFDPEKIYRDLSNPAMLSNPYRDAIEKANEEFTNTVGEQFASQIESLSEASTEQAARSASILYNKLVLSGFNPDKASKIIQSVLSQAGQQGVTLDVIANITDVQTTPQARAALSNLLQSEVGANEDDLLGGFGPGLLFNQGSHLEESNKRAAAYGVSVGELILSNLKKGMTPKEQGRAFWAEVLPKVEIIAEKTGVNWEEILNFPDMQKYSKLLSGDLQEDFKQIFTIWTPEQRAAFLKDLNNVDGHAAQLFENFRSMSAAAADQIGNNLKGAWALEYAAQRNSYTGAVALTNVFAMMAAEAGNVVDKVASLPGVMAAAAGALIVPEFTYTQEDIDKRIKAQEKEMAAAERRAEAQREAIEEEREAIQDRIDNIQEEIDKVNNQYDREIAKIEKAEAKRQEAFANEEERFQKRMDMRNMQISYDEAIANGELYEAARIRMDIAARKRQDDIQTRAERSQSRADKRIKAIERERKAELKLLEQRQKAAEKQLELLDEQDEAIDDHLENLEDAHKAEIKSMRELYDQEAAAAKRINDRLVKIWENGTTTIAEKIKRTMELVGDVTRKEAKGFIDIWEKSFGEMPKKARDALMKNLQTGNWKSVYKGLADVIGIPANQLENLWTLIKQGVDVHIDAETGDAIVGSDQGLYNRANSAGYARGGFVAGPGSGTSDSIPTRLSNGEYVIRQSKVAEYGKTFFDKINNTKKFGGAGNTTKPVGFAEGGLVGAASNTMQKMGLGLMSANIGASSILKAAAIAGKAAAGQTDTFGGKKGVSSGGQIVWIPSSENDEPVDQLTAAQLKVAGNIMGSRFYVTQGSYQPQTPYSGTTHMGGGVIDVPSYGGMFGPGVKALQRAGFAAWWRGPQHGDWGEHIHAISLFSKNLSAAAAAQRDHYINMTGDGLGGPYYGPHLAPVAGLRAKLPGLRKGGVINYDNTIANLHRGEAVLTRPLTNKLDEALANLGGNEYNFDVTIENLNSEVDLERAFEKFVVRHEKNQIRRNRGGRAI